MVGSGDGGGGFGVGGCAAMGAGGGASCSAPLPLPPVCGDGGWGLRSRFWRNGEGAVVAAGPLVCVAAPSPCGGDDCASYGSPSSGPGRSRVSISSSEAISLPLHMGAG